jgi:hypothetical protein
MRTRISPAMVVACLALFVALGGLGYAAVTLPANSVGTPQLKKNAVTGAKVKNKSLGGPDVNQSSLAFGKAVSVSGLQFIPRSGATATDGSGGSGCTQVTSGGDYLAAPLSLPQGARVKKVVFSVIDATGSDIALAFTRSNTSAGTATSLRFGGTSGSSLLPRAVSFTGSPITVVDNTKYTYRLEALLATSAAHIICGGRVEYTLP